MNHKAISYAYGVLILTLSIIGSRHVFHNRLLSLAFFILLLSTYRLFYKLLVFLTGNLIFQVCPCCGYTNKTLSDHCTYCDNKGSSGINLTKDNGEPTILLEEISEYKNAGAYGELPQSILKGLCLSSDEVVMIFSKVQPIRKNGNGRIYDTNGLPCMLNRLCLTNKKIYFIASLFGGWRVIDSYTFELITEYIIGTRPSCGLFKPYGLDGDIVDQLTIKTCDGNEYRLKGLNPQKLYLAAVNCIKKKKGNLEIIRRQASSAKARWVWP